MKKNNHSVCAVLGCGGGKSVVEAEIARLANAKGNRVLFIVHRRELCAQIAATFSRCGVDMGMTDIQMVQTATRRLDKLAKPDLIITDECHHALASSYRRIYDYFSDVPRVGFTATPIRLGDGGLGEVFDDLITSVSTKWLIENGYLAPYKYYSYKLADTSQLHVRAGEYIASEVHGLMEKNAIYGAKPVFSLAMEFATIISAFLETSFLRLFSRRFSVSMEKPTTT